MKASLPQDSSEAEDLYLNLLTMAILERSTDLLRETISAYQPILPASLMSPPPDTVVRAHRSDQFSSREVQHTTQRAASPSSPPPPYYPHNPDSYDRYSRSSQPSRVTAGERMSTPARSSSHITQHQLPSMPEPTSYAHYEITQIRPYSLVFHKDYPSPTSSCDGYETAVPLHKLGKNPASVICPKCKHCSTTKTKKRVGNTTHAWAFAASLTCCLCLVPYLMGSLKDIEHRCGKCNRHLVNWHRSGTVEVLVIT